MSLKTSLDLGIKDLCREYAEQATTHGLRRIAETKSSFGKFFWTFVFLIALAGCFYHCSFLIQKYLKFSKVTTTEEIHAKQLEFPALTVCNMNILKNAFFTEQLAVNENTTHERKRGFCYSSEENFLNVSEAKDLSDVWSNLGVTLDHLKTYGHQVYDLIVQCTYNANDCFNQSITADLPLETENITITDYLSTRLGFCHTIKLNRSTLGVVKRTGQTLGLTLTLNIERDLYWDLLSPEFGVRILIHPREAYPTIDRGGIVLHPGTKTYLSIRIREIERLPAPYGDCTETFRDSPFSAILKEWDDEYLTDREYYTYEFCQSLCRESHLYRQCKCVEEQVNSTHTFCNPCNSDHEKCKESFKDTFDSSENNPCTDLCKPASNDWRTFSKIPGLSMYETPIDSDEDLIARLSVAAETVRETPEIFERERHYLLDAAQACIDMGGGTLEYLLDTRYDVTLSTSEWPNLEFQEFVLKRWPELRSDFTEANSTKLNETYLNKNFLRVHVFIQEMNYLRFKDVEAYTLPELFADLGGCLGLYIGVSLMSIIEFQELLLHIVALIYTKLNRMDHSDELKRKSYNISRSRSVDALTGIKKKSQGCFNSRPEGTTLPIFYIRSKRRTPSHRSSYKKADVQSLTDEETYSGKMCCKCLSEVQSLQNDYLHRRKGPKVTVKSILNVNHSAM